MLVFFESVWNRWRNNFCQLLHVHGDNFVVWAEVCVDEPLENISLMPVVLEIAVVKLNWYKSPVIDQILMAVMQVQHESFCCEIQELNAVIVLIYKKGDETGCNKLSLSDIYRYLLHTLLSVLSLYVVCKGVKRYLVGKCEGKILL